jgi:hypothetical protein
MQLQELFCIETAPKLENDNMPEIRNLDTICTSKEEVELTSLVH